MAAFGRRNLRMVGRTDGRTLMRSDEFAHACFLEMYQSEAERRLEWKVAAERKSVLFQCELRFSRFPQLPSAVQSL